MKKELIAASLILFFLASLVSANAKPSDVPAPYSFIFKKIEPNTTLYYKEIQGNTFVGDHEKFIVKPNQWTIVIGKHIPIEWGARELTFWEQLFTLFTKTHEVIPIKFERTIYEFNKPRLITQELPMLNGTRVNVTMPEKIGLDPLLVYGVVQERR